MNPGRPVWLVADGIRRGTLILSTVQKPKS
jgi:hypothetical protein